MPPLVDLASFPNSRISTRPVTRISDPFKVYAPAQGEAVGTVLPAIGTHAGHTVTANGNIMLAPVDGNRVYAFIRNTHLTDNLAFGYNDVANLEIDGNFILPNEGYDAIPVDQAVYLKSCTANRIIVQVELGLG